jgi:Family of unknown function (DUF6092)
MSANRLPADPVFDMSLYLVASARDGLDEPVPVCCFRMVEGVSRLLAAMGGGDEGDPFLAEMKGEIDARKLMVAENREAFAAWLDELLGRFAEEAKQRATGGRLDTDNERKAP